ncbi:MAG: membrane dipeptidase [Clostridia bacterium]|nr:membrane dipeptidase [Clostridia bacterium]
MISFADLHSDTLYKCFENNLRLSDASLHVNSSKIDRFDRYIQCFAHFIREDIDDKWNYLCSFLKNSNRLLNEASIPIFNGKNLDARKLAVLTVEGGDIFNNTNDMEDRARHIASFHVALFSMIYNHTNSLGCGAFSKKDTGLTAKGRLALEVLERYGILLDVSHASYNSANEIIDYAKRPVCATHSNACALTPHARNLPDEILRRIAQKDGLVGVNFYPPFLSLQSADFFDIMRHIKHLQNVCGYDHVVFGCDFDGVDRLPYGIHGVESMEELYVRLSQNGFTTEQLDKLFYKNVKKFMQTNF